MKMRAFFWIGGLALAALLGGCAPRTVNHVLADPYRYSDKEISLKGRVIESVSLAGKGFYRLEDPTGRLWIFSSRGVPRKGARVKVRGRIHDAFDLSSLGISVIPEALRERIESGLLMVETSHRARG